MRKHIAFDLSTEPVRLVRAAPGEETWDPAVAFKESLSQPVLAFQEKNAMEDIQTTVNVRDVKAKKKKRGQSEIKGNFKMILASAFDSCSVKHGSLLGVEAALLHKHGTGVIDAVLFKPTRWELGVRSQTSELFFSEGDKSNNFMKCQSEKG